MSSSRVASSLSLFRSRRAAPLVPIFALLLGLALLVAPSFPALPLSLGDLPIEPPSARVLDARLVTVSRLDYGLTLPELSRQLLERWSSAPGGDARLLLLIDSQTKSAAIAASPALERQLPPDLLRSTARTTMAQPLREGNRYRQASLDALERLSTVLRGGEDPGEPAVSEATVVATNIPTREETASSNAFTWVVVLLVVGTIVPMLTWWVFSR